MRASTRNQRYPTRRAVLGGLGGIVSMGLFMLRDAIRRATVDIGPGRSGRLTISVGVAQADPGRVNQKGLLAAADTALYRAKAGGRNRVVRAHHEDSAAPTDGEAQDATAAPAFIGDQAATPVPLAARRRSRQPSAEPALALKGHR